MVRMARRSRSRKQWTSWTTQVYTPTVTTAVAAGVLATVALGTLIAAPGTSTIDRYTILRIKGELILANTGAARGTVSCGIIVERETAGALDAHDPSAAGDASLPWMWLRHTSLQTAGVGDAENTNQLLLPGGAHVDIKVKRIVRPDEAPALHIISTVAITYQLGLRMLIAKVA